MEWFTKNGKAIGMLISLAGGGVLYLAGTLEGQWSVIVGAIGTALTGAGGFLTSKLGGTSPTNPVLMVGPEGGNGQAGPK